MAEQWGLSPFSIGRLRAGASVSTDGFTLWLENGQVLLIEPGDPERAGLAAGRPGASRTGTSRMSTRYREGDEDWPMLVELCGKVYQAQGPRRGAPRWIEMLPQPYQSEMWRVLEGLDAPGGCRNRTTTARSGNEHGCTQTVSREEYRRLDNRVTCILQQRWPANGSASGWECSRANSRPWPAPSCAVAIHAHRCWPCRPSPPSAEPVSGQSPVAPPCQC